MEDFGFYLVMTNPKVGYVECAKYPSLKIVGLSTHNPDQARDAIAQKPDYIGCGPVWATPTKDIPDPTLGVETAVAMAKSVPFPAVCIGGIDFERLPALLRAGARNYSVVRAVCASDDPFGAICRLKEIAARTLGAGGLRRHFGGYRGSASYDAGSGLRR